MKVDRFEGNKKTTLTFDDEEFSVLFESLKDLYKYNKRSVVVRDFLTDINNSMKKKSSAVNIDDFVVEVLATAGFSTSKTNVVNAKASAKKALASGIPKEDILKAAEGIRNYKGDITPTIRSPFQSTSFWMGQVKSGPKGVWNG